MEPATVNLSETITFDLSAGRINLQETYQQVLLPTEGLNKLCEAAGEEATRTFGTQVGKLMGERIMAKFAKESAEIQKVSAESFVTKLRAEFALAGMGSVSLEKWGSALLLVLDHGQAPVTLAGAALESAISTASGRSVRTVHLMHDGARDRFLLVTPSTAEKVTSWLTGANVSWGEVLVRLHTTAKQ